MGTLSWINGSSPASPAHAVSMLHSYLSAAGVRRLYAASNAQVASLSVRTGLTVWCINGTFRWSDDLGQAVTHPADDPEGAARRLNGLAAPLSAAA
ncbi:hypothetical protein HDA32_000782 [Spinactinospora alkalitolerans]|uniref:Uncharacterized protein n=1 Tax=Spinactinospora alkalitolerans TaxID=687207 RepID=A0A852TS28_9ACTN|nr:hypothetical protein [Spinactinospora alkalitolerans]NYE45662.1 hypothetical protein [Spinactinospora alkalitolerans]